MLINKINLHHNIKFLVTRSHYFIVNRINHVNMHEYIPSIQFFYKLHLSLRNMSNVLDKNIVSIKKRCLGIPLLDILLDIDPGMSVLIEQDPRTNNHVIFEKLFVAQSVMNQKKVCVRSKPFDIPAIVANVNKQEYQPMRIAWRYTQENRINKNSFDLFQKCEDTKNVRFTNTIEIAERTCISSLYAPHEELSYSDLFKIKKQVIEKQAILLATSPVYLVSANIGLYFDIVLSLESDLGEENGYHGILKIKKNPKHVGDIIYGYKIGRYGIAMETFSMAPDDVVTQKTNQTLF